MNENKRIEKQYTRKCIVTNQIIDVNLLTRINYDKKENKILLDKDRILKNRGAYFINTPENWEKFKKTKALNRAFRRNFDNQVYLDLEQQLKEGDKNGKEKTK